MSAPKKHPILPIIWPEKPLLATQYVWDMAKGEHPAFTTRALQNFPAFAATKIYDEAHALSFPHKPCQSGHNVILAHTPASLAVPDERAVPISPLFVRDLAGRVIHIGAGITAPEKKGFFPDFCQDVSANVPGADLIENVFFVQFRTLVFGSQPNGKTYSAVQKYPYKLRVDSFYQDGWRLPQVERLYVRPSQKEQAENCAQDFLHRWKTRTESQSYEDWVEANGGSEWFETLFLEGVTVVPTVEACNGYNKVGANFELIDFLPGRATTAFHEVVGTRPDATPKGSILTVVTPGLAMSERTIKAKVIVSDGSGYTLFHAVKTTPKALWPNMALPHPKTTSKWGTCWLPTHPSHFEPPALWDWENGAILASKKGIEGENSVLKGALEGLKGTERDSNGKFLQKSPLGSHLAYFLQQSGPLWDPVHYFYKSTPLILRAFRTPLPENRTLARVPEAMKSRFYPAIAMPYYDTFSEAVLLQREGAGIRPLCALDHVPMSAKNDEEKTACTVGYHPLPRGFSPELDDFALPVLAPKWRNTEPCPTPFSAALCPVIHSFVSSDEAQASVTFHSAEHRAWQNKAYYGEKTASGGMSGVENTNTLPPMEKSMLAQNVRRAMGGKTTKTRIDALGDGLYTALWDYRSAALSTRRARYRQKMGKVA